MAAARSPASRRSRTACRRSSAPEARNARTTLAVMGALVGLMFLGMSILAGISGAIPSEHETVISQIGRATFGTGPLYYILQFSTMGILVLAANTAFADFPRLSSLLARDGFMPSSLRLPRRAPRVQRRDRRPGGPRRSSSWPRSADASRRSSRSTRSACSRRSRCRRPAWSSTGCASAAPDWRRSIARQRVRGRRDGDRHRRLRGRQVRARRVADRDRHPAARRRDAVHRPPVPAPPARDRGPAGARSSGRRAAASGSSCRCRT